MKILIITHYLKLEAFFWISKAFVKVWHKGFLYKLESLGISRNLNLFCNFANNRHERVVLNGQLSDWAPILTGVPRFIIRTITLSYLHQRFTGQFKLTYLIIC